MANPDAGLVVIQHDGVENTAKVTRAQFDGVWASRGWTILEDLDAVDPQLVGDEDRVSSTVDNTTGGEDVATAKTTSSGLAEPTATSSRAPKGR